MNRNTLLALALVTFGAPAVFAEDLTVAPGARGKLRTIPPDMRRTLPQGTLETPQNVLRTTPQDTRGAKIAPRDAERLRRSLAAVDQLSPGLARLRNDLDALAKVLQRGEEQQTGMAARRVKNSLRELIALTNRCGRAFDQADTAIGKSNSRQSVDAMRSQLEGALQDLESQDRMGNFEIQTLMSRYNQAERLASSVEKKKDDTDKGILDKI